MLKPHDRIFTRLDKTPERDGRTDGQTESLSLLQRSALRAMWTRCKTCVRDFVLNRSGKIDTDISLIHPLKLTVGQKLEVWPQFSATSKQAWMLLLSSLQLCILTDSV